MGTIICAMHNSIFNASVMVLFATLASSSALGFTTAYGQQQMQQQQQQQQLSVEPEEHHEHLRPTLPFGLAFTNAGNFSFGEIASIQNNESGQPAWILVGHWRGNLFSFNQTTSNYNNTNTSNNTTNATTTIPKVVFNADFRMIMLNGSAPHSHVITNFNASNISSYANGTKTFTGTSTISLREGPQTEIPTIIKISGQVISILPDPSRIHHHFGNTPIYGVLEEHHRNERQESQPRISIDIIPDHQ